MYPIKGLFLLLNSQHFKHYLLRQILKWNTLQILTLSSCEETPNCVQRGGSCGRDPCLSNNICPWFPKTKSFHILLFGVSSLLLSFNHKYRLKLQLHKKRIWETLVNALCKHSARKTLLFCLTRAIRTSVIDRRIRTSAISSGAKYSH